MLHNDNEMHHAPSTFAPFRRPVFRTLWLASQTSNLGGLIQSVGAAWLMTSLAASADLVALVQSSITLPIMLFSLTAGVFADNFDRRRVMLSAQGFMLIVSAILATLAFWGLLTPWLLLGLTFLIGCGTALHNPSWQASVRDLVPRDELPAAVAMNSVGFNLMRSVGPAIGGLIVAIGGAAFAFAVNAFSYIGIIAALLRWQPEVPKRQLPREPFFAALGAGLRYVLMSPNLLKVILRGGCFGVCGISVLALLPVVTRNHLDGTSVTYGILLGAFGVGAIGGALLSGRLRQRWHNETVIRIGFAGFALGTTVLALAPGQGVAIIGLLFCGSAWVLVMSMLTVSIQMATPRWVSGRAIALHQTITFGGMALGSWGWGQVAHMQSTPFALILSAVLLIGGVLIGLIAPLEDYGDADLDPSGRFREPPLRLDLTMRSGPILVTLEYIIAQEDIPDFLSAMARRRRVRIRDGARQWTLLRDLENPDVWTESYHVPTWTDYVRHNLRRTKADVDINDILRNLHKGGVGPKVRRMIERQNVMPYDDTPLQDTPSDPDGSDD